MSVLITVAQPQTEAIETKFLVLVKNKVSGTIAYSDDESPVTDYTIRAVRRDRNVSHFVSSEIGSDCRATKRTKIAFARSEIDISVDQLVRYSAMSITEIDSDLIIRAA